jgi:hypothetical protein
MVAIVVRHEIRDSFFCLLQGTSSSRLVAPEVIKRWLAQMAYGKEEYVVGVDKPMHTRAII